MSRKRKIFLGMVAGAFLVAFAATHAPISGSTGQPGIPHLDKVVHATIYFVLGSGVLVGLRMYHRPPGLNKVAWVVFAMAAYAAVDESSQMLIPGRQADLMDWFANLLGIVLSVGVMFLWHAFCTATRRNSATETVRPGPGKQEQINQRDTATPL